MKLNTPYIIPRDPDMSQQIDLPYNPTLGMGWFDHQSYSIGKGLGILGASSQKANIYLEPNWPLFLKVNPPKEGPFQSKQGSFGF